MYSVMKKHSKTTQLIRAQRPWEALYLGQDGRDWRGTSVDVTGSRIFTRHCLQTFWNGSSNRMMTSSPWHHSVVADAQTSGWCFYNGLAGNRVHPARCNPLLICGWTLLACCYLALPYVRLRVVSACTEVEGRASCRSDATWQWISGAS